MGTVAVTQHRHFGPSGDATGCCAMTGRALGSSARLLQQLGVLPGKWSRRNKLIAPVRTQEHQQHSGGGDRAGKYETAADSSQATCGLAAVNVRALTFMRRPAFTRAAAQPRAITMPTVAVACRPALGQGRADAARARSRRAGPPILREPTDPGLVRPIVVMRRAMLKRFPHNTPPWKACATSPCSVASSTSTTVRPMWTNSQPLRRPCRASWKSRSSLRRTKVNSFSQFACS